MNKKWTTGFAPHLRGPHQSSAMVWPFLGALLPAVGILIFQNPAEGLKVFGFLTAAALFMEFTASFGMKKKPDLRSGSPVLFACLLGLLVPRGIQAVWLGLAALLAFGSLVFYGGKTRVWMHPSWLGAGILAAGLPAEFFSKNSPLFFWNPFSGGLYPVLLTAALCLGGLYLSISRRILWKLPVIYLSMVLIPCLVMGLHTTLPLPVLLLNAFWILSADTALPCSARARIYFAAGAGLLTLLLDLLSLSAAPIFAVLVMNLFLPWMDQWILPRGLTFQAQNRRTA